VFTICAERNGRRGDGENGENGEKDFPFSIFNFLFYLPVDYLPFAIE
jgi:hypothetical protein